MPQVIAERYELLDMLGRGGMGAVWRARDRTLDREVAIKEVELPPGLDAAQRERVYARTFREARSAARLDHPGIVTVYDVVEHDGRPWIVMQLVRAPALDSVIATDGPLPPGRVAAIGVDLLEALRAAHAAGVIHRDVKPGNVLLPHNRAVLTDFGIATVAGDETLTQAGAIVGSPAYLAPEMARRQKASPASDLWSLGATLYAAVEGRPPYQRGDVWGVMAAVLSDEPDPTRLAGPLQPVLQGLLQKDPELRMRGEDASHLLREIAQGAPVRAMPGPNEPPARDMTLPPIPASQTVRPHPGKGPRWPILVPAGILAMVVIVAAVVLVIFVDNGGGNNDRPPGSRLTPTTTGGPSSPSASAPSTTVPQGFEPYRNSLFAASIPKGWTKEGSDDNVTFKDPNSSRGIAVQKIRDTPGNERVYLTQTAESLKGSYQNYNETSFNGKVPYQDGAAELEFTFTKDGKNGRCRVRLFSFNGALYLATMPALASGWSDSNAKFDAFLNSFRSP
ncbi:serine/threonine protein kinase [Actinomadura barringtoniae]|uniref:non-specific serine/threonine protein kinase n=1 Tax=Actinomadura barringtoniae TaxID=1427535 RepID=A0A939PKK7_9ACTN|nr:serine/threonine-protein kinase [Actinomadura barringtoniae]MBO2450286.1 serine/threonine protein kinase [Actinomadura barringtoniae]